MYGGSSIDALTEVACADHGYIQEADHAPFKVESGHTYYIQVGGGYFGRTGKFTFTLTDTLAPSVTAPACKLVTGTTEATTGIKPVCTWTGTAHGSPIADYTVTRSTDGRPFTALETTTWA